MGRIFKSGVLNQYTAGSVAGLSYGLCGMAYVWVNPLMGRLQSVTSELRLSGKEVGWAASLPEVGAVFSALIAGALADRLGRRSLLVAMCVANALAWFIIAFTKQSNLLLVVRGIQGVVMGVVMTVLPMYLGEIADNKNRGRLSVLYTLGWNLGLLFEYSVGPYVDIFSLNWINILPTPVLLLVFWKFSESPYYYAMRDQMEEARQALESFRDKDSCVETELAEICKSIAEEKGAPHSFKELTAKRSGRKALLVVTVIFLTFYLCGSMSVLVYCNDMFLRLTGEKLFGELFTIALAAALTLSTLITMCTIDSLGRRPVLVSSYATSTLCLLPAAIYFILMELYHIEVKWLGHVAAVGLVCFPSFITLGAMTICHTYQAELFTTKTRSLASSIMTVIASLAAVLSLFSYQPLEAVSLNYITYTVYVIVSFLGLIFCIFLAPETKGKSFVEIQKDLQAT